MKRLADSFVRHAGRIAVEVTEGQLTYAELDQKIQDQAAELDSLNALRVAYQLDNGLEFICLNLALLRTGRVGIPIPHFFSQAQCSAVLADCGADHFFSRHTPSDDWQPAAAEGVWKAPIATVPARLPENTALITYTSGTTGSPKGVCLSAAMLLDTAESICTVLQPVAVERHLCVLPLSLLLENVAGLYANLLNGGTSTVPPLARIGIEGSSGLTLETFLAAQNEFEPHSIILVPQLLLALTVAAELGLSLPASYRFAAVGGGKTPVTLLQRARAAGIPAYEGYGLTECGSVISLNLPDADLPGSVGRPLPHVQLSIERGEIVTWKPRLLGYTSSDGGMETQYFQTGDLGSLDESGFLRVAGRRKNSYSTAFGRNISPEWIESELTSEIEIAHAAVFGEAEPINVALLVGRGGADEKQLASAVEKCNARLPDYARISTWKSLEEAELRSHACLTDNGRLRRNQVELRFEPLINALFERNKEFS